MIDIQLEKDRNEGYSYLNMILLHHSISINWMKRQKMKDIHLDKRTEDEEFP